MEWHCCIISDVAVEREVEGDLLLGDLGQGVPFRAGAFDGALSISALQWLCNADKSSHNPAKRLYQFFSTLYASLVIIFLLSSEIRSEGSIVIVKIFDLDFL